MITLPESLVWYSTPESRGAGKISLLACAETVLAVTASLVFATSFSIYTQILISLMVAPLVLLRSDAAVAMAWRWFRSDPFEGRRPSKRALWGFAIAGALLGGGVAYGLATMFLKDAEGWHAFAGGALIAYVSFSVTIAAAILGTGALEGEGAPAAAAAAAGALAGAAAAAAAVAGALVGALAGAAAAAAAAAGAFARERARAGALAVEVAGAGAFAVLFGPGLALGAFTRALTCRIVGALWHLPTGAAAIPQNWQRILFVTDTSAPPELLPAPPDSDDKLDLRQFWSDAMEDQDRGWRTFMILITVPLCLPSVFYRLSIKSTFWLYGPLIYLAWKPPWTWDHPKREVWIRKTPGLILEWVWLIFACITLITTFWTLAEPGRVWDLAQAVGMGETPFTLLSAVFVLDISRLQPWHPVTITSAVLTIGLFFWLDHERKHEAAGGTLAPGGFTTRCALLAWWARSACAILWILMMLWYTVEHLHLTCRIPDSFLPLTSLIYGPADCPLQG